MERGQVPPSPVYSRPRALHPGPDARAGRCHTPTSHVAEAIMRCLVSIACTVVLLVASAPCAMAQATTDNSPFFRVSVGTGLTAPLDLNDSRTVGLGARGSLT